MKGLKQTSSLLPLGSVYMVGHVKCLISNNYQTGPWAARGLKLLTEMLSGNMLIPRFKENIIIINIITEQWMLILLPLGTHLPSPFGM
jgi:hypothetical protein